MRSQTRQISCGTGRAYTDKLPVDVFIAARAGTPQEKIAASLGVSVSTWQVWKRKHPGLRYALEMAEKCRTGNDGEESFTSYIEGHLSAPLRGLWKKISFWDGETTGKGAEMIQVILGRQTKAVRQQLWVHAYMMNGFNASKACRMVGIAHGTLREWSETDPNFPRLLEELKWHKQNWVEEALMDLIALRKPEAVIFANRTLNRDRGYGDKLTIDGEVRHQHHHTFSIDELNLPLETRKAVLEAIRAARAKPALPGPDGPHPAPNTLTGAESGRGGAETAPESPSSRSLGKPTSVPST